MEGEDAQHWKRKHALCSNLMTDTGTKACVGSDNFGHSKICLGRLQTYIAAHLYMKVENDTQTCLKVGNTQFCIKIKRGLQD